MNRVIVTGGNGFIGKHLVKKLLSTKVSSVVLVSNSSNLNDEFLTNKKLQEKTALTCHTADIRDKEAILQIFREERPEACIHLAAKISVTDSIQNPDETMDINVKGTLNVLEACYESEVSNFVFASSAAVYGDVKELPISENQALRPLSPYGTSKMLAEQHISSYKKLKKIQNAILLRIFNVYGNGQTNPADVISKFAKRISNGLPPIIYGKGKHTRDFISVADVTDAFLLSIQVMETEINNIDDLTSPPIFNIGTGIATSIKEVAEKMIAISGLNLEPVYVEGDAAHGSILHSHADITKAKKILNFVPKKSIEIGLMEMLTPQLGRRT